jgi:hypothetical protein
MSAMPEENDLDTEEDAFVEPSSDGLSSPTMEGRHEEQQEGISVNVADILREEDERSDPGLIAESNGTVFGGYRSINKDDSPLADESSELVLRQGAGRPSSADGSLSIPDDIPDDVPSLKV